MTIVFLTPNIFYNNRYSYDELTRIKSDLKIEAISQQKIGSFF